MNKKKLISIGIVVLTLVVVIVIAATVGSNDSGNIFNDDTNVNDVNGDGTGSDVLPNGVTPSVDEIILLGYSAEVTEKSLKVYKDNVFVQELVYPTEKDAKFDLAFATQHLSFLDMNFDGKEDICLAVSSNQDGFNYYCWLYDSSKDEFVFNNSLSDLKSISVDSENKQIVSKEKNKKGETVYSIYEWKKDRLVKLETKDSAPDSVKDSELGSTTSNSASRPSTNNGGSQGGSTKPNGSSGVLVPGGNKPSGSGGVVLATENPNDIWY